jgi:hypothetical protein
MMQGRDVPGGSQSGKPAKGVDITQDVLAAGAFDQSSTAEFGQDAAHIGSGALLPLAISAFDGLHWDA